MVTFLPSIYIYIYPSHVSIYIPYMDPSWVGNPLGNSEFWMNISAAVRFSPLGRCISPPSLSTWVKVVQVPGMVWPWCGLWPKVETEMKNPGAWLKKWNAHGCTRMANISRYL